MKINKVKAFVGFGLLVAAGVGAGLWMAHQRQFQDGAGATARGAGAVFADNGAAPNVIPGLEGCQSAEFHGQIDKKLLAWNSFINTLDKNKSVAEQLEQYRKENGLPVSIHENVADADENAPDSLISPSNCSPRPMTLFLKHFLNGEVNFRSAGSSVLPAADVSELVGHRVTKHWPAEPDAMPEFISDDTLYFKRMLIPECATCVDETCQEHHGPTYYLALNSSGVFHVVDAPAAGAEKFEGHDIDCPPAKSISGIDHEATILCREYVDMASNKKRVLMYDPPCDEDQSGASAGTSGVAPENTGSAPDGDAPNAGVVDNGRVNPAAPAEEMPGNGTAKPADDGAVKSEKNN